MTVSLVTGASTGIGFAVALRLARDGHRVRGSVRSPAGGQDLLDAAGAEDLDLDLVVMDVDDDSSVAAAIAGVLAEEGAVEVLVNNAGITRGHAVEETPLSEFQAVMNTNAWGLVRTVQAVLPSMRERGSGRILNVTSAAGRLGNPTQGAYCMSKWAAEAFTEVLAAEVAPFGVLVSAIEPGVVATPIFEKAMSDPAPPGSRYVANRRLGEWFLQSLVTSPATPEDVAEVVAEAVAAGQPRLRYLVGADAERLVDHREAIGGDEWVARIATASDDEWWSWMTEVTGVPRPG